MKLWIARDKCGYSQLYVEKPIKKDGYFEHIQILDGLLFLVTYSLQ